MAFTRALEFSSELSVATLSAIAVMSSSLKTSIPASISACVSTLGTGFDLARSFICLSASTALLNSPQSAHFHDQQSPSNSLRTRSESHASHRKLSNSS